jgi:hypothetical protein
LEKQARAARTLFDAGNDDEYFRGSNLSRFGSNIYWAKLLALQITRAIPG